jgi:hypothetical protein
VYQWYSSIATFVACAVLALLTNFYGKRLLGGMESFSHGEEFLFETTTTTTEELMTRMVEENGQVSVEHEAAAAMTMQGNLPDHDRYASIDKMAEDLDDDAAMESPYRAVCDAATMTATTTNADEEIEDFSVLTLTNNRMAFFVTAADATEEVARRLEEDGVPPPPPPSGFLDHARNNARGPFESQWVTNKKRGTSRNYRMMGGGGGPPAALVMLMKKKAKLDDDGSSYNNNWDQPAQQLLLMNEPIENDYDALIAGYGLGSSSDHSNGVVTPTKTKETVLSQRLGSHHPAMGVGWKDIFDNDHDNAEDDGEKAGPAEPRVGVDSWQMHVVHRLIQKLPAKPQAVFKSIAARAMDRHFEGEVRYNHLPGSIFEDIMTVGAAEYAELFLEHYITVRNEMHQLENVTSTAIMTMTQRNRPPPIMAPLQLAMGYAFVLGMKHAQAPTVESSLNKSLLDQAKVKMNNIPPAERCRVWEEFVALANGTVVGVVADGKPLL